MLSLQIRRWVEGQAPAGHGTDMLIPANPWPRVDSLNKTARALLGKDENLMQLSVAVCNSISARANSSVSPANLCMFMAYRSWEPCSYSTSRSSKHYPCNCQVPNPTGLGSGAGSRALEHVGQDTQLVLA
jgi:hypothetical protein